MPAPSTGLQAQQARKFVALKPGRNADSPVMAADMVGTEQRRDQPVNPLQDLPPLGFTGENEPRMGLEFFADRRKFSSGELMKD